MFKKAIKLTILLFSASISSFAQMDFRAWQILSLDTAYSKKVLDQAPDYHVNRLILSHGAISYAMELYEEDYYPKKISEQGKQLKQIAQYADQKGVDTYIWLHELGDIPPAFIRNDKVQFDNPKLFKYINKRYERIFKDYPEFDGVQLTFHETHFKIFDDTEVNSSLSKPERFYRLMNTIFQVCKKQNKELIIRTFLYTPEQYAWMKEGLDMLDDNVIIENKYTPNDWQPFFPHNKLIADIKDKRQIIEFDASAEYQGRNYFPWAAVDHLKERLNYAQQFDNTIGYNVRLNHAGYDAMFNPNAVNVYTLARVSEDPTVTSSQIWKEWSEMTYGTAAAQAAADILKPTYEIVNKIYFPQKVWFGNHSKLTHYEYGLRMVPYLADWDSSYQSTVDELLNPTRKTLLKIEAEKDSAIMLIQQAQWRLFEAKDLFEKKDYDDLTERLLFLHQFAILSKSNAKLFWGLLFAKKHPEHIPEVEKELGVFRMLAQSIPDSQKSRENNWLLDPLVVEKVAQSIENELAKTESR